MVLDAHGADEKGAREGVFAALEKDDQGCAALEAPLRQQTQAGARDVLNLGPPGLPLQALQRLAARLEMAGKTNGDPALAAGPIRLAAASVAHRYGLFLAAFQRRNERATCRMALIPVGADSPANRKIHPLAQARHQAFGRRQLVLQLLLQN